MLKIVLIVHSWKPSQAARRPVSNLSILLNGTCEENRILCISSQGIERIFWRKGDSPEQAHMPSLQCRRKRWSDGRETPLQTQTPSAVPLRTWACPLVSAPDTNKHQIVVKPYWSCFVVLNIPPTLAIIWVVVVVLVDWVVDKEIPTQHLLLFVHRINMAKELPKGSCCRILFKRLFSLKETFYTPSRGGWYSEREKRKGKRTCYILWQVSCQNGTEYTINAADYWGGSEMEFIVGLMFVYKIIG